jgi:hypothetical protein
MHQSRITGAGPPERFSNVMAGPPQLPAKLAARAGRGYAKPGEPPRDRRAWSRIGHADQDRAYWHIEAVARRCRGS